VEQEVDDEVLAMNIFGVEGVDSEDEEDDDYTTNKERFDGYYSGSDAGSDSAEYDDDYRAGRREGFDLTLDKEIEEDLTGAPFYQSGDEQESGAEDRPPETAPKADGIYYDEDDDFLLDLDEEIQKPPVKTASDGNKTGNAAQKAPVKTTGIGNKSGNATQKAPVQPISGGNKTGNTAQKAPQVVDGDEDEGEWLLSDE
jgi:hypothetical protein